MKGQETWRNTPVDCYFLTDELTRLGHPTELTEPPKIPFHTSHFSMCTEQLHSTFTLGLLLYVSNDFKMNSAYQQGIIAPPLKLMRVMHPSPPKEPMGVLCYICSSPSTLHCEGRGQSFAWHLFSAEWALL